MSAQPGRAQIRDYLLRRMDEAERAEFESAYFKDDRLLDRVEEEEDGLVSEYVLGKLDESDRRRFEESLLGTPYYRERVETTSRLRQRLSQHRAFDRRGKGTAPAPKPVPRRRAEDQRLFPGRTGTVIAFAFLAVLFVASVLSALRLRSELDRARARAAVPSSAERLPAPTTAVVPTAQSVVLLPGELPGPPLRRLARTPGAPLLLVVPARALPAGTRAATLVVSDPVGTAEWRSGRVPVEAGAGAPDLALRLPVGIPADGRAAVTLVAEGTDGNRELSLGLLEVSTAAR